MRNLSCFPPRYLDAVLGTKPVRDSILYISQAVATDVIVSLRAQLHAMKPTLSLPLLVKPHPLEDVADLQKKIGAVALCRERKLTFVPKYAVTHSSALGLELLFQGTIVFFLDRNVFDVTRDIPYLYCADATTVASRIRTLERDPTFTAKLHRQIRAHLVRRYKTLSLTGCIETLNTMETNLKC